MADVRSASRFVTALSLTVLATSCTGSGTKAGGASPQATLQRAARATSAAHGFQLDVGAGVTMVYRAPDRFRSVEHGVVVAKSAGISPDGPPSTESGTIVNIYIGTTWYRSGPTQIDRFTKEELPLGQQSPSNVLAVIEAIGRAQDVTRVGGTYRFRLPPLPLLRGSASQPLQGEAELRGGFLRTLRLRYESGQPVENELTFSRINSAGAVEPPAPSQLESSGP